MSTLNAHARLALASVTASAVLALIKLHAAMSSGSLALLGSALDAGLDIGVTAVTYIVVRIAERPADRDHHFGHLRLESLTAFLQTLVLLTVGGVVIHGALQQLGGMPMTMRMERTGIAVFALVVSAAVDLWRSAALGRAARRSGSAVLAASALSFRLDFLNALLALAGLLTVGTGYMIADPIAAGLIGVIMVGSAVRLLRGTVDALTDRAPAGIAERAQVAARTIDGVMDVPGVRVRPLGRRVFIEVTIAMDGACTLARSERTAEAVRLAIVRDITHADVVVLARPAAGTTAEPAMT